MKYEIANGTFVGTAEWRESGSVELDMEDDDHRAFFERYFSVEDSTLDGPVECAGMGPAERRDASPRAFGHAMWRAAAYAYRTREVSP